MNQNDPPTEHILACLSSSPSNAKIVRTAATMAKAFGGTFTALYVRTPDSDQMGKEDCRRLQQHIRMAEQAGADISTIYGDDIPQQIAEFARISGITKIVLGRSSVHRRHFWSGPSLTEKLTLTAPNLDIYIIPDASAENGYDSGRKLFTRPLLPSVRDLLITAGILSCITLSKEMLKGIDVLVYDIQDIGCRSFTYISTLGNVMKAAAENGIKVMVLDRPNPLGGEKVEGCLTEDDCISFVSQFKIPYVYGLTPGEVALLLNGENMLGKKCDLEVIKMKGWKRRMTYEDTGLQWVLPSPHIPHASSAPYYSMSGIVGELDSISIGVGYTMPFQMFGAPWIKAPELADRLNALNLPGVMFRPMYYTPFYAFGKGQELQGVQVYLSDYKKARLTNIQFVVLQELYKLYPDHDVLAQCTKRHAMFDKVCGSKQIRQLFMKRHMWEDVQPYWDKDAENFKKLAKKYWLYK